MLAEKGSKGNGGASSYGASFLGGKGSSGSLKSLFQRNLTKRDDRFFFTANVEQTGEKQTKVNVVFAHNKSINRRIRSSRMEVRMMSRLCEHFLHHRTLEELDENDGVAIGRLMSAEMMRFHIYYHVYVAARSQTYRTHKLTLPSPSFMLQLQHREHREGVEVGSQENLVRAGDEGEGRVHGEEDCQDHQALRWAEGLLRTLRVVPPSAHKGVLAQ
jgi:hypothetical protein